MYLCLYLHATLWMLIKMFMLQLTQSKNHRRLHALILRLIFANIILWLGEEKHRKNHILSDYSDVKKNLSCMANNNKKQEQCNTTTIFFKV